MLDGLQLSSNPERPLLLLEDDTEESMVFASQPNNNFSNVKCMVAFGNTNVMFPNDLLVMSQNDGMTGQHVQPYN